MTNIKSQALVGNTGAADDDQRILRYLNKAYQAVFAKLCLANPSLFQQFQTVEINSGVGTFPNSTFMILSVCDTVNNRLLKERTMGDIEAKEDPALSKTGTPAYYDRLLNGLYTYPINTQQVQIRYTPNVIPLTLNTLEATIMLPPAYHEVLEWATLFTLAYDERDMLTAAELEYTKARYDELEGELMAWAFACRPPKERRVDIQKW